MTRGSDETTLEAFRLEFHSLRALAEKALGQLDDDSFFRALDGDANSPALLVKHIGGNLRSRWTDVFTSDGEKADRRRDAEFELDAADTRARVMEKWAAGWDALAATFDALAPDDLERVITVRGEPHTLPRALTRSLSHTAGHVHQIVLLARHLSGSAWRTLSIPRGQSDTFRPPR
jgi:Protein of unknown function (DUF1572)